MLKKIASILLIAVLAISTFGTASAAFAPEDGSNPSPINPITLFISLTQNAKYSSYSDSDANALIHYLNSYSTKVNPNYFPQLNIVGNGSSDTWSFFNRATPSIKPVPILTISNNSTNPKGEGSYYEVTGLVPFSSGYVDDAGTYFGIWA
jgi:hypothetical protein